eukprot:gb/GECH01011460.1/.p1 GENE.gb/GECH01011460.1/~~gb/GECH01011460.1/.p1  ORF type:complete len:237 (+),score=47.00 gb/GECH01011460.1/:1-711(+)
MTSTTQLALSFVVLALSAIAPVSQASAQDDFDFYLFVQSWPGTGCETHHCDHSHISKAAKGFTIHGLWPNDADGHYPSYCHGGSGFDSNKLKPIMSNMERYWPSLWSSNDGFWEHEWEKHGRCATQDFKSEEDYFYHGLKLHKDLDILNAFQNHGIHPDHDKTWPQSQLISAVKNTHGVTPIFQCSGNKMKAVWIAVDHSISPRNFPGEFMHHSQDRACGHGDPNYHISVPPFPDY